MQFLALSPRAGLLLLNVVAASLVLAFAAIIVVFLVRRASLSLRHGLLCVALGLTLASPLPIWIASNQGIGIVPVSLAASDHEVPGNVDPAEPMVVDDGIAVQVPKSLDKGQTNEATAERESSQLTDELMTQTAKPGTYSVAVARAWSRQLSVMLAAVWAAIALWLSLRLARGLLVIQQLRRSLRPTSDPRLMAAVARIATNREACPNIYESHLAPAPLTLGWWRSVIVMPEGLAELLDNEELECVLAHEAAHVARHDTAIAILQQLCAVGFWWNPLLHAVNRQINRLRERICDDSVVECCGDGLPLARALVRVAEWSARRDVAVPFASTLLDNNNDDIENRIKRLADRARPAAVGLNAWSATLIGLFGIVLAVVPLVPVMRAQAVAASPAEAVEPQGNPTSIPRIGAQAQDDAPAKTDAEKANDEREARLARVEPEFKQIYQLTDNEVLRHVPEPLDRQLRLNWFNAIFGNGAKDERMEIVTLFVQWKDKRPQWKGATVGFGDGGMPIRSVLSMLDAVSPQYVEGDDVLLDRKIPGDWIFDPQAPADKIVAALELALRKEWGMPLKLGFRDLFRDVYVVSGEWKFKPVSVDFPDVQIYGRDLDKDSGNGGGTGKFDKFLAKVGSWIDMPIVNEVLQPPSKRFSWRYHIPSPTTQQQRDDAHNPEEVTANLTEQTGLEFVKERRKTRVLFLER